ncbi:hypothetical protein HRbin39_01582 [bacterium HR39]|nr:hypothetical protein HRbin39_01582 [bacterium HR39]
MLNGIRHLVWDAGQGLEKESAHRSGVLVLIGTVALTVLVWAIVLLQG